MTSRLSDLAYAAGWGLVKAVPDPIAAPTFRLGADLAHRRGGAGVEQLRRNLARVRPEAPPAELDALVGEALRSYARYWKETFRLPRMNVELTLARVHTIGTEHLDAAVAAGRGYVVALPHMGNYDIAGLWTVARHGGFTTVAERLEPTSLFDRFVAYRQSLGMEVLPLTGGDRSPADVMLERVQGGGGVCLVADRDLSRSGIEVQFFGEKTRMPGGPALLAARTGAALLPCGLWFTSDGGWGQQIGAPIAVPDDGRLAERVRIGTQAMADAFADRIADHPADWHMLQVLWPADRGQD